MQTPDTILLWLAQVPDQFAQYTPVELVRLRQQELMKHDDDRTALVELLDHLKTEHGVTRQHFAHLMGISASYLSLLLNDKRQNVPLVRSALSKARHINETRDAIAAHRSRNAS